MATEPPALHRIALDFDIISADQTINSIELKWDKNHPLNDTFTLEVEESSSASSFSGGDESSTKRKWRKGGRNNDEDDEDEVEARLRRRKWIVTVLSVFPFLIAVVTLAVMMASKPSSNGNFYATTHGAVEAGVNTYQTNAPTFATYASSVPEMMLDATNQPSRYPTSAAKLQLPPSDETHHGGLRSTPPTAVGGNASPYRPDAWQQLATPDRATDAPSSGPPTTAPTGYCVRGGLPCPNKNLALCCSDVCVRSQETGERLCAPVPETLAADATANEVDDLPPPATGGYCVKAGRPCPNKNFALCCSDVCVKNKDTGERVCAPIQDTTVANTSQMKEEEEYRPLTTAGYCVKAGIPCPNKNFALCCSDICEKNKETGERVCAPILGSAAANMSWKEEDRPPTCVRSGYMCPDDERSCCGGRCSSGKTSTCL